MQPYTESRRPAALDVLKSRGPLNAPALARALGVTITAVRQQLAILEREGLVESRVERRKVGRPTHVWMLTERAAPLFPQAYGPFALALLRQIRDLDGDDKVRRLLEKRLAQLVADYRARMAGLSREQKLRMLARIRDEEGYMAACSRGRLAEHHCPIASIAKEFPIVCQMEKQLFEAVLGESLERTDHIASGGRACVYERPRSRKSS